MELIKGDGLKSLKVSAHVCTILNGSLSCQKCVEKLSDFFLFLNCTNLTFFVRFSLKIHNYFQIVFAKYLKATYLKRANDNKGICKDG